MIKEITSPGNKIVKSVKKLSTGAGRAKQGLFFAEGERLSQDALRSPLARFALVSQSRMEAHPPAAVMAGVLPVYVLPDRLFHPLCDTKTPQGIGVVCALPEAAPLPEAGLLLVCDGVGDPGNIGTMLRSAECAGASAVLLLPGCADPFSPKAVRASMGSVFRLPIRTGEARELAGLHGFTVMAAALDGSSDLYEASIPQNAAIVIGSEARGVSPGVLALSHSRLRIPMCGEAESLNAAVAASVILYEAYRQRKRSGL